jgi:dTDP-4-amino-4,6-dideoxygalactose transaminase
MTTRREIPFGRPWITDADREAVMRVLSGHILTHGPECKRFETDFDAFLGHGAHSVTVSSCMAALHLSYLHLGIGRGDEVIAPALTHVATAHAIEWVGAKPVFVDCDPQTGNLTAAAIEKAITHRTRAISVVHFAGIPCDMKAICGVAERHGLKIVEDCAIAIGARRDGIHVGLFGDAGCFSFYPVKHFTTGEGGMFVSRHATTTTAVARLRAFGVDRSHGERAVPGMYEVPELGLNYRMSEMAAALGSSQLSRVDQIIARRAQNFEQLSAALADVPGIRILDLPAAEKATANNSHYCAVVVLDKLADKRNAILAQLGEAGIGTSVYYPQPVPRMKFYRDKYGFDASAFPETARISDGSIALPVGPHIDAEDVHYMARTLRAIIARGGEA